MFTSKCIQCHKWQKNLQVWLITHLQPCWIYHTCCFVYHCDIASTWWWEWEGSASITACSYCCAAIITLMQTVLDLTLSWSQKDHVICQKVSLCHINQATDTAPRQCFNIWMVLRDNGYLIQWQKMPFLHSMFTLYWYWFERGDIRFNQGNAFTNSGFRSWKKQHSP